MSEMDMDHMPRMKDYLKPEDLNTEACVDLAAAILSEAGQALTVAAQQAAAHPTADNMRHLKVCRDFYQSEMFQALSLGAVDGTTAAKKIIQNALRGRAVKGV